MSGRKGKLMPVEKMGRRAEGQKRGKGKAEFKCQTCGIIFYKWRISVNKYCSKKCMRHTKEWKDNLSKKLKSENNGMWKGDSVGLDALHIWVRNRIKKPKFCQYCKTKRPYDLANISQKYKRDLSDWEWLCRKCHMIKDGRLKNLISFR